MKLNGRLPCSGLLLQRLKLDKWDLLVKVVFSNNNNFLCACSADSLIKAQYILNIEQRYNRLELSTLSTEHTFLSPYPAGSSCFWGSIFHQWVGFNSSSSFFMFSTFPCNKIEAMTWTCNDVRGDIVTIIVLNCNTSWQKKIMVRCWTFLWSIFVQKIRQSLSDLFIGCISALPTTESQESRL